VAELWTDRGPTSLLRDIAHERCESSLKRQHFVLLRVALDFYDGSGNITMAELMRRMDGCTDDWFDLIPFLQNFAMEETYLEEWVEAELRLAGSSRPDEELGEVAEGGKPPVH
jgi:hypothetical protein